MEDRERKIMMSFGVYMDLGYRNHKKIEKALKRTNHKNEEHSFIKSTREEN